MNCIQILNKSQKELKKFNIKNVELDCEILLSNVLKVTRENLLINLNKKLDEKEKRFFFKYVERTKKKEPIAYIIGYKDFWKKRFYINNITIFFIKRISPFTMLIYIANISDKKIFPIN